MTKKSAVKFSKKRNEILHISSAILNQHGAQGFRRADVAAVMGFDTSTISYYFRRKDDLIAECISLSLDWILETANNAAAEASPELRVNRFVRAFFDVQAAQRRGERPALALLSDLPTLSEENRVPLGQRMRELHRIMRNYLEPQDKTSRILRASIATNLLLSTTLWLSAWINEYRLDDFERAISVFETLCRVGIMKDVPAPSVEPESLEPHPIASAKDQFLLAATRLINKQGYLGARVDLISAELGVSTGSFYHHLKTKDEVVLASFDRTFSIIENAFELGRADCPAQTLANIIFLISHHQIHAAAPLLSTASYQALPEQLRREMSLRSRQQINHISGLIADGVSRQVIPATDPFIAANFVYSALQSLATIRPYIENQTNDFAVKSFFGLLCRGMTTKA